MLCLTPETQAEVFQLRHLKTKSDAARIPLINCSEDWDSISNNSLAAKEGGQNG